MASSYEILGVPHTASKEEIKKAYRKLALIYHPDVTRGDELMANKFLHIKSAYEQLMVISPGHIHQQYQAPVRPFAVNVHHTIDSKGDAVFHFIFKNMIHAECIHINTAKNIHWNLYGGYCGDLRIPKQFLIENDYCVTLYFTGVNGSTSVKAYVLEDPRSLMEILKYRFKTFIKRLCIKLHFIKSCLF